MSIHRIFKIISKRYFQYIVQAKPETFVLLVFVFSNIIFLTGIVGSGAFTTIGFLFLLTIIINLKLKKLTYSVFLVALYSLQFYTPNKYYEVEVFKPYQLVSRYGNYILSYGVNLKNIFLGILAILILRQILYIKRQHFPRFGILFRTVWLPGIIYLTTSAYSSLRYSPYLNLSLVWLFHYSQMYFIAFLIYFFYLTQKENFKLIGISLEATLILQSAIALLEFTKQSWWGIPIENARYSGVYFGAPDALSLFFRVIGTFAHSNQLALIMTSLLVVILPKALLQKKPLYIATSLIVIGVILLTLSRSGWISLASVLLLVALFYKQELGKFVRFIGLKRLLFSIILIISLTSIVVVPRAIRSLNAFDQGAGVSLRSEMFKEGLQTFTLNPWVGYGIGTNEPILLRYFPSGYVFSFPAPIHMAYIQMLLESGIIGLISFVFPFLFVIRKIIYNLLIYKTKIPSKIKDFMFITLGGILSFALYYLFQPHEGFREFYYLGIFLGYGLICIISVAKLKNEATKHI